MMTLTMLRTIFMDKLSIIHLERQIQRRILSANFLTARTTRQQTTQYEGWQKEMTWTLICNRMTKWTSLAMVFLHLVRAILVHKRNTRRGACWDPCVFQLSKSIWSTSYLTEKNLDQQTRRLWFLVTLPKIPAAQTMFRISMVR